MKRFLSVVMCSVALIMGSGVAYGQAQLSDKELKKEMKARVDKDCRKEAKALTKEGWKVMPGKLPLERQLQESRYAQLQEDERGQAYYIVGTHMAKGGNYTAAKKIADSRAMTEIAEKVSAQIAELVKENVANHDYGEGDIEVIDKFVSSNKHLVNARLTGAVSLLEIYREVEAGAYEVRVVIAVRTKEAVRAAKSAYVSGLAKESEKLAEELDSIL